jgi:hypothetical protein
MNERKRQRMLTLGMLVVVMGLTLGACSKRPPPNAGLEILAATATSQTSIVVTFNRAVDTGAGDPANYRVSGPTGDRLDVLAAYPAADGVTVALATAPQQPVTYVLTVRNIGVAGGGAIAGEITTQGGFGGSGEVAPIVASAIALSNTQVLVTFADPTSAKLADMGDGALTSAYYEVAMPNLEVLGVAYAGAGRDRSRVILTTSSMSDLVYTVKVTNVLSATGSKLVDPFVNTAQFRGITRDDAIPPTVTSVFATSNTTLVVRFSEPVSDDAASPSRYTVKDSDGAALPVVAAVLNDVKTEVTLTTWPMTAGVSYSVTVAGITDRNGNPIAANATTFDGTPVDASTDVTGPRVLSANSTSNTTVVVTFDEPVMGGPDSAENPLNYSIVESSRMGSLLPLGIVVVREAVLSASRRTVTLTTLPQTEVGYTLRVTDVKDLVGNQVLPPDRDRPYQVTFFGTGTSGVPADSDGDGLSDAEEQFGWAVTVRLLNGTTATRWVTSDPGDPSLPLDHPVNVAARDTDGDGVPDADEKAYGTDPRASDTDGDQLSDYAELNLYYSDPTVQDTDGDGLTDGLEVNFFGTSPMLQDTDGDGLDDGYEVVTGNRNPLIADLPQPQIRIGAVDLSLDVRFETATQRGESAVDSVSRSVSLQQDESTTVNTTDARTNEWFFKAGAKVGFELVYAKEPSSKVTGEFSTEGGVSGSSTFQVSRESARASSRAYADTLSTDRSFSREETLTRRVEAAEIAVLVDIENLSNIAFEMSDIEITALIMDPRDPRILTPVATLFPANPNLTVNLGPLDSTARGPFRFVSQGAFPARIEELMRNPRGIVFRVANFNIRDEEGRNFAFGEQDANDRTAPLVLDFGVQVEQDGTRVRGAVERYRVATASTFDDRGRPVGITVAHALERILGLTHYDEATNPTASLTEEQRRSSYSTMMRGGVESVYRVREVAPQFTAAQILAGSVSQSFWAVLFENGIDDSVVVRQHVLQPERGLTLAFVQDLDGDGVPARVELYYGSSDLKTDSDEDRVAGTGSGTGQFSDNFEIYRGWNVEVQRGLGTNDDRIVYQVRSSPVRIDTDGDGLTDWEEQHGCLDRLEPFFECDPDTGFGITATGERYNAPTDPANPDTDGDRILDGVEVFGFFVQPNLGPAAYVRTDPTDVDTDNDGVADGDEIVFGGNPTIDDVASFTDTDGDGLLDAIETAGWTVTFRRVSTIPGVPGALVTCTPTSFADCVDANGVPQPPTSDPRFGFIDTDGDGLTDAEEYALGTHPRLVDTDGDGISDFDEVRGRLTLPFDGKPRFTNPLDADTDNDLLSDGFELTVGWDVTLDLVTRRVFSDPTTPDLDGDGLWDNDERTATATSGTDPNNPDTDGDGTTDRVEVLRLRDTDTTNNTDPLAKDQLVSLAIDGRGVKWTNGLICGVINDGSARFGGTIDTTVNAALTTTTFDVWLHTNYVALRDTAQIVYRGGTVNATARDVVRYDGTTRYNLKGFNEALVPSSPFTPIPSTVQQTFRLLQQPENNEVCAMDMRFTLTPIMDR